MNTRGGDGYTVLFSSELHRECVGLFAEYDQRTKVFSMIFVCVCVCVCLCLCVLDRISAEISHNLISVSPLD